MRRLDVDSTCIGCLAGLFGVEMVRSIEKKNNTHSFLFSRSFGKR